MPRHPPCALNNLRTPKQTKKTERYSRPLYKTQKTNHTTTTTTQAASHSRPKKTTPTTTPNPNPIKKGQKKGKNAVVTQGPVSSGPNSAPKRIKTSTPQPPTTPHTTCAQEIYRWLLRKEVIQPHLPVRLPCYDFVLIASPTFDHSPHQTVVRPWASGVTDFHDVTGGVYKARERIHRSNADLRLLATPTS
jgi:hypothetical protein